ncbi:MAG: hypothetical protein PHS49_01215 [Candidatus Gracilibacteria bacterium]|nr:hypothetical protein [Candidatus Gracilibacteria bacterium]
MGKLVIILSFLFISCNYWYTYNSFPNYQLITIKNITGRDIDIKIEPIYKFDNSLNTKISNDYNTGIYIFGGGEYGILEDKNFEVKGYYNNKEIYSQDFKVSDFTKGYELEPEIIINDNKN